MDPGVEFSGGAAVSMAWHGMACGNKELSLSRCKASNT